MYRDTVYIAGLLHDIGKVAERTKNFLVENKFTHIGTGHPKYSAYVMEQLINTSTFFYKYNYDLMNLVLYHHEPRNDHEKIILLADKLSSKEREEGETNEKYFNVPLRPIFSRLFEGHNENFGYELNPLSISTGFPKENANVTTQEYSTYFDAFYKELTVLENETQLYYILEKYLWCVPAQTTNYIPDISLFDHLKTTAAIALCLFDEYQCGSLSQQELTLMDNNTNSHFMLINGDISGIQDFIFNMPSKGAAKSLKGHSVYIALVTDAITRYLIKELRLKEANVLYNGGGNFYILAPKSCEEKFLTLRTKISEILLKSHQGTLYLALDYILLSPSDFSAFNVQWERVKQKVNVYKNKKWSEIGLQEHYADIFGPKGTGAQENEHCKLCGTEKGERRIEYVPDSEKSYCTLCKSYIDLTDKLKDADYLVIKEVIADNEHTVNEYIDVFRAFGFDYSFINRKNVNEDDFKSAFLINDTSFLESGCQGFIMGAYRLPFNENGKGQLTFKEISEKSKGDPKIALLKLDVDNLGNLFFKGLGKNSTISRVTALSRMLALYFEGYINYLIEKNNWQQYLYVVFSGGDDTFIVGAWDKVLDFVQEFYNKFREFTCYHHRITFSAGIGVFRYDFPVIMSSRLVEEALENAKGYVESGEVTPSKNKISLFGEIFNWSEFAAVREFKSLLCEIMNKHYSKKNKESAGRSFLYKIWKSTLGFKRILQDSLNGKVDNIRFWRLAYYLKDIARDDSEKLINKYKEIVLNNLFSKSAERQIKNIMVVPAAVKWAQMETRNKEEDV
ncbi:MAG: type III-A CRISPR-associated protein Cas10/Csm1 [Clostridiaceae bacterium]|nr:type III-A CRISPR-associated protein Cas10/Csm1 [Clostridiaceae bacterium]